jgi:uncharacterized protein YyaL (SSP411 family)
MAEPFRFSPNDHRADDVRWQHWTAEAFEAAAESERPIFLHLTTTWCRACHEMDEGPFSDERIIELINDNLVPIRVDADRLPHVQDRYIAAGWPTSALLAPSGEVFWSDNGVSTPDLRRYIEGVLDAWRDRRDPMLREVEKRRKAMEAARSRRQAHRMVRREAADDVLTGAEEQFDARNGGFGDAPKFIHAEGVELLFSQGRALPNPNWTAMAERSLDGMVAGEIEDRIDGGFFHYALQADWTMPQVEKLLSVNARVLSAFVAGVRHSPERDDWREVVMRTVDWVDGTLGRDGLWAGSQAADPGYYADDDRSGRDHPPVDGTIFTDSSAMWIAALADAGQVLGRDEWTQRAAEALDTLLDRMAAPGDSLVHYAAPDAEPPAGLLVDLLHAARAALAVARTTDEESALDNARRLVGTMKETLWDQDGGFADTPRTLEPLGVLRFRDRPFEENALAARLHIGLARRTGSGSHRVVAERILGLLSPVAGRYAIEGATFAMGVEEFFELRR